MNHWFKIKVKLATVVEGDLKAPFSIATKSRCRGGHYFLPRIPPLYPWYVSSNAECWTRKYQVPFFGMTRPRTEPWCPRPLVKTLPTRPINRKDTQILGPCQRTKEVEEHESDSNINDYMCSWNGPKRYWKKTGRSGNQRNNKDNSDYSRSARILGKGHCDLRRLAVSWNLVKNHQLTWG